MAIVAGLARATYRAALPGFIKAGLSQRATMRTMKTLGLPTFRITDMKAMFREMSGISKMQRVIRFVRKDYLPSKAIMNTSAQALPRNYLYKIKLDVYDAEGNFVREKYTSVMTDDLLRPGDSELAALEDVAPESSPLVDEYYTNARIDDLYKSPGV